MSVIHGKNCKTLHIRHTILTRSGTLTKTMLKLLASMELQVPGAGWASTSLQATQ